MQMPPPSALPGAKPEPAKASPAGDRASGPGGAADEGGAGAPHPTRLLLVDERPLYRDSFALALQTHARDLCIATAADAGEAADALAGAGADAVILFLGDQDMDQGGGRAVLDLIAADAPGIPVIVLRNRVDMGFVLAGMRNNIRGFISPDMSLAVVVEAINLVRAGGTFVPAYVLNKVKGRG